MLPGGRRSSSFRRSSIASKKRRCKRRSITTFDLYSTQSSPTSVQHSLESPRYVTDHRARDAFWLNLVSQPVVEAADPFPAVWSRFHDFLKEHKVFEEPLSYAFLTCGDWDLKTMLPKQLEYETIIVQSETEPADPQLFGRWINIKTSFVKHYGLRNAKGMKGMLSRLKLPLEGRHHSGIDDCKNIARIVEKMQKDGWNPSQADLRISS